MEDRITEIGRAVPENIKRGVKPMTRPLLGSLFGLALLSVACSQESPSSQGTVLDKVYQEKDRVETITAAGKVFNGSSGYWLLLEECAGPRVLNAKFATCHTSAVGVTAQQYNEAQLGSSIKLDSQGK